MMDLVPVVILTAIQLLGVKASSPDGDLATKLLKDYDKRAIARVNHTPLLVYVGFTLVQLHSLDEKNQMLTSSGWFQVEWNDYRLKWNATEYNRTNIVIPSKELWLPDIGFLNSASIYHASMIRNEFRCVVYSDGSVLWVPGGTYYTTCELDISKFPFDKQMCYLHLTNWAYNIGEMNLTMSSNVVTMDSYKMSAEWAITKTHVTREEVVYECCGDTSYPALYFYIWIERKSLYYIVNIIIPCVILSLLANFTFCVPPDSGEKISLGITLLLSFTVFQLIVAESIPRRSDSVPVISLYISVITGVVTASIISTIFISQLHHRGAVPLPNAFRVITFDILARLVFLDSLRRHHGTKAVLSNSKRSSITNNNWNRQLSQSTVRMRLLNGQSPESIISDTVPTTDSVTRLEAAVNNKLLQNIDTKLEQIIETLSEYESRRVSEDNITFMKDEWHAAGKVFDRFFFVMYIMIMLIITIKFLVPVSGSTDVEQWGIKNI